MESSSVGRFKHWDDFYSKTSALKMANSSDNMFTDEDIVSLRESIKRILVQFFQKGDLNRGIKVYVNKELRNNFKQKMADRLPAETESIEEWCKEIFGDNKFGVVFNSLESYDNEIAEKMCNIVSPLLEKAGLPLGGLSFLFFMGNYGFTPFGIHKEANGEEGFLFHLGPAEKKFYTWDIDELNRVEHNMKVFHNVDEMLPDAESYLLKPKSVIFIPHYLYHIANTDEFSLSVVMDYINPSSTSLENTIAKDISSQSASDRNSQYLYPISLKEGQLNWEHLLDRNSWEERYKTALTKRIYRLRSNSGVSQPSLKIRSNFIPNGNFTIKGKAVFPLLTEENEGGKTLIYARGHEIMIKSNSNLSNTISRLNNLESIHLSELQRELQPDWGIGDIFDFVNQLMIVDAVEVKND